MPGDPAQRGLALASDATTWAFDDEDSGLAGRCDTIDSSTDGRVDEDFIPTLELPIGTYGSSAAMIYWAQTHLSGAWGLLGGGRH